MNRTRPARSIRRVLVLCIAFSALIVMLSAGAVTHVLASNALRSQAETALLDRARGFASLVIEEPPDPIDEDPGGVVLDFKGSLNEEDLGVVLRIYTQADGTIAQSPDWPTEAGTPPSPKDWKNAAPAITGITLMDGRRALMATVPGRIITEISGDENDDDEYELVESEKVMVVQVIADASVLHSAQRAVLTSILIGTLGAGLGILLTVRIAVSVGLRPLIALVRDLERLNAADPSPLRLGSRERSELMPIKRAINDLLSRVRSALERERRFTDSAAHELRTPIAELRSISDVAMMHPDPERLARCAHEAGDISVEMTRLIEALLQTARSDAPEEQDDPVSTMLVPCIESVLARHREQLESRNVTCRCAFNTQATWAAPHGAVSVIVRNLIENAVQYTPVGGSIVIVVTDSCDGATLEIRNKPVTLTEADTEQMFDPFWRADSSRSDRANRGLGLAIVASQCKRQRLIAAASLKPESMLVVSVRPIGT